MADGTAIIGDPRNDEHVVIAGMQAAFLKFHNNVVDQLRAGGTTDEAETYSQARRLTTWHYQWLILYEFLPLFIGQSMVNSIVRRGRRFYRPRKGEAFIPVESRPPRTGSATRWCGPRTARISRVTTASRSSG
jgi:Animal haem peroxidase